MICKKKKKKIVKNCVKRISNSQHNRSKKKLNENQKEKKNNYTNQIKLKQNSNKIYKKATQSKWLAKKQLASENPIYVRHSILKYYINSERKRER